MVIQEAQTTQELLSKLEAVIQEGKFLKSDARANEAVNYMMAMPGKRFRPLLVLQACDLFNADIHTAIPSALGIEVFHNFTLVHDDIMDEAELRRGRPTVHTVYGSNVAIITGDMLLCHAYSLLCQSPNGVLKETLDVFSTAALGVMEGQQMDMEFEGRQEVNEAEYLLMIEKKTSVLLAAACQIGAIIGGATQSDAKLMYDFGKYLGLMFQIKDDLLDAFGTHERVGKKMGGDIIQNKKTYLHISAMNLTDSVSRKALIEAYSIADEEAKVNTVKAIFEQVGARKLAEAKMQEFRAKAVNALDQVNVTNERKSALRNLATSIFERQF